MFRHARKPSLQEQRNAIMENFPLQENSENKYQHQDSNYGGLKKRKS